MNEGRSARRDVLIALIDPSHEFHDLAHTWFGRNLLLGKCIHRSFQKHFEQLRQAQAERKAQRAGDLDNAPLLSQLAKLQNLPYNPSEGGFHNSNAEIDRYTEQFHTLQLAKESNMAYRKHAELYDLPKAA
jgi:hypothetical protein